MKTPPSRTDFESALRRDAAVARQRAVPSTDLEQRIRREVHQSRAEATAVPAVPARNWRVALFSLLAAGACAAVAVIMLNEPNTPVSPSERTVAVPPVAAEQAVVAATDLFSALSPQAAALLAEDPLQTEVDAVVANARSALQFLALNFLPTTPDSEQPSRG